MENQNIIEQLKNLCCSAPREGAKIRAYLHEMLPPEEVEAFEGHLDECEKCSKLIFLEDYLKGAEIELLMRPDQVDDDCPNGRAAAATN